MMQNKKDLMKMIIGLTGGSGTGKSTACRFFTDRGFLIIDADEVYANLCKAGSACLDEICEAFGNGVLNDDLSLNRGALSKIVFSDSEKLKTLNSITHKYIIDKIKEIISENNDKNIVIDAPLLLEAGLDKMCDFTVCILADRQKRIERIMLRDNKTFGEAKRRIDSQKDDEFYLSKCDIAVYNDSDEAAMFASLKKELGKYV